MTRRPEGQESLLEGLELPAVPACPRPMTEFLTGVAARHAFGEKRTAAQNRAAEQAAVEMGEVLSRLKGGGS